MFKELREVEGTIEVNGRELYVSYGGKRLSIEPLTPDEMFGLLEALTGKKSVMDSARAAFPQQSVLTGTAMPPVVVEKPSASETDVIAYVTPHEDPPKPMAPTKSKKKDLSVITEEFVQEVAATHETSASTGKPACYLPSMEPLTTMRELLMLLADGGMRKPEDFTKAVMELKEHLNCLKNIQHGFESRLERCIASLNLEDFE